MKNSAKSSPKFSIAVLCFVTGLSILLPHIAAAQPFVPDDRSDVVVTLSGSVVELSRQLRTADSARIESDPNRLASAIFEAYTVAASSQDARAYGHVSTLIGQWPNGITKPVLVHTISAAVLQHNHYFAEALSELDAVLAVNPLDVQAHMIRAQIGLVTGDYDVTEESCEALQGRVSAATHLNCQAQLEGVTGGADSALTAVMSELESGRPIVRSDQIELQITAAVLAHRLGRMDIAERFYLMTLLQSPQHFYTLVHYGNFLLEQGRDQDVIRLMEIVPEELRSTEINILLAEAYVAVNDAKANALLQKLDSDFELAFLRTDAIPHKEYARYALVILNNADDAVQHALNNWREQKEPADGLLLARAAAAASDQSVLAELHQWFDAKGTEDKQLEAIFTRQGLSL